MKIFFRVDASQKIGTGHVMRCLTLAAELRAQGAEVEFICRNTEGELTGFIAAQGFKTHKLARSGGVNDNYCYHADWLEAHWAVDAEQTASIAKGADWLVVDHYAIDEKWEKVLKHEVGKIMVIDDLADRKHDCDLLLDQNFYLNFDTRYKDLLPSGCTLLLSPRCALLRPEFAAARLEMREKSGRVDNIFIFFSGVDNTNETGKAVEAISGFKGAVTVVAGGSNRNFDKLQKLCADKPNFTLYKSVGNMAELMKSADLAVGAGGSASWERAALGLPALVWPIAENQKQILHDLNEIGAVKLSSPKTLMADINALQPVDLAAMAEISGSMCNGFGAKKVANYIMYNLRPAVMADCREIFEIRNKKEVRENSTGSEEINFGTHEEWFKAALTNPDKAILVLENVVTAGVLRFDIGGRVAEVSVYLDPDFFGRGLGETIMEKGKIWLKTNHSQVKTLTAKILPHNLPSKSLFSKLGFVENGNYWVRNI